MSAEIAGITEHLGHAHDQVRELARAGLGVESLSSARSLLEEIEALHATVQGLVMLLAQRRYPGQEKPFAPRQTATLECEGDALQATYDAGKSTLECEGQVPAALGAELLRQFLPLVAAQLGVSEWGGTEELVQGPVGRPADDGACTHDERVGVGRFSIVHGGDMGRGGIVVRCENCGLRQMRYRFAG